LHECSTRRGAGGGRGVRVRDLALPALIGGAIEDEAGARSLGFLSHPWC
jgi:hypothetical protein